MTRNELTKIFTMISNVKKTLASIVYIKIYQRCKGLMGVQHRGVSLVSSRFTWPGSLNQWPCQWWTNEVNRTDQEPPCISSWPDHCWWTGVNGEVLIQGQTLCSITTFCNAEIDSDISRTGAFSRYPRIDCCVSGNIYRNIARKNDLGH